MTGFVLQGHISNPSKLPYAVIVLCWLKKVPWEVQHVCDVLLVMNNNVFFYFLMYAYFIQAGGGMEPVNCLRTEAIKAPR